MSSISNHSNGTFLGAFGPPTTQPSIEDSKIDDLLSKYFKKISINIDQSVSGASHFSANSLGIEEKLSQDADTSNALVNNPINKENNGSILGFLKNKNENEKIKGHNNPILDKLFRTKYGFTPDTKRGIIKENKERKASGLSKLFHRKPHTHHHRTVYVDKHKQNLILSSIPELHLP